MEAVTASPVKANKAQKRSTNDLENGGPEGKQLGVPLDDYFNDGDKLVQDAKKAKLTRAQQSLKKVDTKGMKSIASLFGKASAKKK